MKKILLSALSMIPGLLFAQSSECVLNGHIGNLNKPAKVYMIYTMNDKSSIDSADMINGKFQFKIKADEPVRSTLIVSHDGKTLRELKKRDMLEVYLEPKVMTLSPADSIAKATVMGSQINAAAQQLKLALKPVEVKINKLYTENQSVSAEIRKSSGYQKETEDKYNALEKEKNEVQTDFVKHHPQSVVSLYTIKEMAGAIPDVDQVLPLYNSLSANVKESASGKKYEKYLANLAVTAIGRQAPEIAQPDTAGVLVKLSSYKGKYVLVDFWASWCGPCRAENPNLVRDYAVYHPKGFEVLGVSLDQAAGKAAWIKAIHDDGLPWTQVSDLKYWNSEVAKTYSVRAIPQNFLIGPDGKIVAKNLRGDELTKKLAEIFGNI